MSDRDRFVPVKVRGLMHDPSTRTPIVVLRDEEGERFLPIWIGLFEAQAIALALEGLAPPRPMPHDLLASIMVALGATLERVLVSSLREGTFYGVIEVTRGSETFALDARPSDAIALALRQGCPVYVRDSVFEAAKQDGKAQDSSAAGEDERARRVLESLSAEDLGKYKM